MLTFLGNSVPPPKVCNYFHNPVKLKSLKKSLIRSLFEVGSDTRSGEYPGSSPEIMTDGVFTCINAAKHHSDLTGSLFSIPFSDWLKMNEKSGLESLSSALSRLKPVYISIGLQPMDARDSKKRIAPPPGYDNEIGDMLCQ